ncbi:hypothetical protein HKD37_03G007955 [Glycine soja]
MDDDVIDNQIKQLEREAYSGVLRAFTCQSDDKNLRLCCFYFGTILINMIENAIRESRQRQTGSASHQHATKNTSQPVHGDLHSPTDSTETDSPPSKKRISIAAMFPRDEDTQEKGKDQVIPYRNQHNSGQGGDDVIAGRAPRIRIKYGDTSKIPTPPSVKGKRVMEVTTLMNRDMYVNKRASVFAWEINKRDGSTLTTFWWMRMSFS